MARPRLDQPRYHLVTRHGRFYVRWWKEGWHRVSARTADRREAERFLAQLVAGTLEPPPPEYPTIGAILDGYLADRDGRVASYATLQYACAALRRHLGDLTTEHLTTTRARLYARQRRAPVPIADALRPYLLEARSGATCDAVIEFAGGRVASVKTGFHAACRRAGLAGVTPHTLRHTAATWMAHGRVPMAEIARYLGDSERTTEKVYAKHSPDYLRGAAKVLGGG